MTTDSIGLPPGPHSAPPPPLRSTLKWFGLITLVGAVAGLGAVAFYEISHAFAVATMGLAGYHPVVPRGESGLFDEPLPYDSPRIIWWAALLFPAVGGALCGLLVTRFAPEARGHGTDAAVGALHRKRGVIHPRVIWVKAVASILSLGTGGSGGREGPIAQMGAGFGSWLATQFKLSVRERRILLAVGIGAGIGAIFRAPLAGALFAAEIMYSRTDFESEVILPSIVGCVVSYEVFTAFMGQGSLFATDLIPNAKSLVFENPLELIPYSVLGLLLAGLGIFYVKVFYGTEEVFDRLKMPGWTKPALGGLLTGAIGLAFWQLSGDGRSLNVLAFGYSAIQEAFDLPPSSALTGHEEIWGLAAVFMGIAILKIFTTSLTISSGGSAGVFGPSMVIGGSAGVAVGLVAQKLWPEVVHHPGTFAIVGMAVFFTGVANVPISTLLMVSEITGNYRLLLPVMWVETLTYSLTQRTTIYRAQVPYRMDSPAHRGEFIIDVLEDLRVRDVAKHLRDPSLVKVGTPLREIMRLVDETRSHYFPVVGPGDRLVGIFSINDIRRYLHDEGMWDLLVAADIMLSPVITLTLSADLGTALRRFTLRNIDEIPVVKEDEPDRIIGMLGRREVIGAYNQRVEAERSLAKDQDTR